TCCSDSGIALGPAGDRRNDADPVVVADWGLQILEEANVFVVVKDVHVSPDASLLIQQSGADPGVALFQVAEDLAHRPTCGADFGLILRVAPKRSGNSNLGHI